MYSSPVCPWASRRQATGPEAEIPVGLHCNQCCRSMLHYRPRRLTALIARANGITRLQRLHQLSTATNASIKPRLTIMALLLLAVRLADDLLCGSPALWIAKAALCWCRCWLYLVACLTARTLSGGSRGSLMALTLPLLAKPRRAGPGCHLQSRCDSYQFKWQCEHPALFSVAFTAEQHSVPHLFTA